MNSTCVGLVAGKVGEGEETTPLSIMPGRRTIGKDYVVVGRVNLEFCPKNLAAKQRSISIDELETFLGGRKVILLDDNIGPITIEGMYLSALERMFGKQSFAYIHQYPTENFRFSMGDVVVTITTEHVFLAEFASQGN